MGDLDTKTVEKPAWMAQLPDDLKENESLSQFKSLGDFGKKFIEVNDIASKAADSVHIPGEDATDEERAAFFEKLGRPKTEDEYDLPAPQLPEGMKVNEELSKQFRSTAHKLGLSNAQTKELFNLYNTTMVNTFTSVAKEREAAKQTATANLKTEWGTDYDTNMAVVKRAYDEFGDESLTKYLDESGEGNNPVLIKAFYNIGKKMLDDNIVNGKLGQKKNNEGGFEYPNSPELKD